MTNLPTPLSRLVAETHAKFHSSVTPNEERNQLVKDLLQELRIFDPNLSVWDLLHAFDAVGA